MARRVQGSRWLLGLLFVCLAVVISGTACPSGREVQGYSRLLERKALASVAQDSLVADCLMDEARLRLGVGPDGSIPESQFETLRHLCREAARLEAGPASGGVTPEAVLARETDKVRLRERQRQVRREFAARAAEAVSSAEQPGENR